MTIHLMKRQAPRRKESYWVGDCFSRAWGSGLVRPLLRRYLGAPGLHFHLRPTPALGSIAGAMAAEVHGSIADRRLYRTHLRGAGNQSVSLRVPAMNSRVFSVILLPTS